MIQISQRNRSLAVSQTLAMSQRSAELRAQGVDVINLSVGEPDFNTPQHIKEAAMRAIEENYSFYSPVPGYMSLRKAIADHLTALDGVEFRPEQIVVSGGAKQALCNAILSIVNPGDEVVIPTPAWVSYVMVKLAEGVTVTVPATIEQDFKITPDQLRRAITPRTRLVILCSPSNPTGSVYTREELQGLVNVLKVYAMTGWRIGFMAAPVELAKACTKLQGQYTSGASSIAQKAAEAAYLGPQECVSEMCEAFRRRRDLIETVIRDAADLAMYLLDKAHVATVDGAAFCLPGYIRLSYATSDDNIRRAMQRIAEALAALR